MAVLEVVFLVSSILLIYPFILYPLILRALPTAHAKRRHSPDARPLTFALLFTARNEAQCLPETLRCLTALKRAWPELDIRAWNDASTDMTGNILHRAGRLLTLRQGTRPIGKAMALRRLIAETEADVILMMDANVRFSPESILRFKAAFADSGVGAVGVRLVPEGGSESLIGRVYWALEEFVKRHESRTGSTIGCDGAFWGIRRRLYPDFHAREADDFRPSMEPLFSGLRVVTDPGIVVQERAVADAHGPRRAYRIGCGAWHAHRHLWPRVRRLGGLDLFKYVSHKLIRWFAGIWLILAGLSGLAHLVTSGTGTGVAVGMCIATAAAFLHVSPFVGIARMSGMLIGVSAGAVWAMRGGSITTWAPVRRS